jgi:anti-anti-sigma factor
MLFPLHSPAAFDAMQPPFSAATRRLADGIVVVAITGTADLYTAPELKDLVAQAAMETEAGLVMDLTEATFVDSSGLAVLFTAHRHVERLGGRLVIVNSNRDIANTLAVTGIDTVVSIEPTLTQALQSLRGDQS